MNDSLSIFEDCRIGCSQCGKLFDSKLPVVINTRTDPDVADKVKSGELLRATCTNCGHGANVPATFLWHDPDLGVLWFVVSYEMYLRYPYAMRAADNCIKKYIAKGGSALAGSLATLELRIMPLEIFYHHYQEETPAVAFGFCHFVPFPKLKSLPGLKGVDADTQFSVSIIENNYPEDINSILNLIGPELLLRQYYIQTEHKEKEQEPTATFGLSEILLYVSSTVVLPILAGVLANILSAVILRKENTKDDLESKLAALEKEKYERLGLEKARVNMLLEAQKNNFSPDDEMSFTFVDKATNSSYKFIGTVEDVFREMTRFRKNALLSMYLPGDCHVCNFAGNHFFDLSVDNEAHRIADFESIYSKQFSSTTRARLVLSDQDVFGSQVDATKLGRLLTKEKRYQEALEVLLSAYQERLFNNFDLLFNIGFCLKMLGYEEEACDVFESVLVQALNFPSLQNVSSIVMASSDSLSKKDTGLAELEQKALSIVVEANKLSDKKLKEWRKKFNLDKANGPRKSNWIKTICSPIIKLFERNQA